MIIYVTDSIYVDTHLALTAYGSRLRVRDLRLWEARAMIQRIPWESRVVHEGSSEVFERLLGVRTPVNDERIELEAGTILLVGHRPGMALSDETNVVWMTIEMPAGEAAAMGH